MKYAITKTALAATVAALLLTACNDSSGDNTGSSTENGGGDQDPVFTAMTSWDACEVLNNLQPITDKMGIKGWGSSTSEGGEPGTREYGSTWDPDAVGCGGLIYLGTYEANSGPQSMSGEIKVAIVPAESSEAAQTLFEERAGNAESTASQGEQAETSEFNDPWDQGVLHSWIDNTGNPNVNVIAQDGQWVFQVSLYYAEDYGRAVGDEPSLPFTPEELNQWFVDTYFPEVNQTINDKITEVQ